MKRKYKQAYAILVALVIVAAAYTCRMLAMYDIGGKYPSNIRAVLYLLLFALWGYSIDRRILQKQALHCLRLIAALMLFWLILRTLKYEVVTDLTIARYLWYLYYLFIYFMSIDFLLGNFIFSKFEILWWHKRILIRLFYCLHEIIVKGAIK